MQPAKESERRVRNTKSDTFKTRFTAQNANEEYDLVSKNVSIKLRKMDFRQGVLAEELIGKVLAKGLLNELMKSTVVTDDESHSVQYPFNIAKIKCEYD